MSPKMKVTAEFVFGASHRLPYYNGKCFNLHGHNYHLFVTVEGAVDEKSGMVVDFMRLKDVVGEKVLARVAQGDLNTVLDNPTAELFAVWVWGELKLGLPGLAEVRVDETDDCSVVYRGE